MDRTELMLVVNLSPLDPIKAFYKNKCVIMDSENVFILITFNEKTGKINQVNWIKFNTTMRYNMRYQNIIKYSLRECSALIDLNLFIEKDEKEYANNYYNVVDQDCNGDKKKKLKILIRDKNDENSILNKNKNLKDFKKKNGVDHKNGNISKVDNGTENNNETKTKRINGDKEDGIIDKNNKMNETDNFFKKVNSNYTQQLESKKQITPKLCKSNQEKNGNLYKNKNLYLMLLTEGEVGVFKIDRNILKLVFHKSLQQYKGVITGDLGNHNLAIITKNFDVILFDLLKDNSKVLKLYEIRNLYLLSINNHIKTYNDLLFSKFEKESMLIIHQRYVEVYTDNVVDNLKMPENIIYGCWSHTADKVLLLGEANTIFIVSVFKDGANIIKSYETKNCSFIRSRNELFGEVAWLSEKEILVDKKFLLNIDSENEPHYYYEKFVVHENLTTKDFTQMFCFGQKFIAIYCIEKRAIYVYDFQDNVYTSIITFTRSKIYQIERSHFDDSSTFIATDFKLKCLKVMPDYTFNIFHTMKFDKLLIYRIAPHPFKKNVLALLAYKQKDHIILIYNMAMSKILYTSRSYYKFQRICWAPYIIKPKYAGNHFYRSSTDLSLYCVNTFIYEFQFGDLNTDLYKIQELSYTGNENHQSVRSSINWTKDCPILYFIGNSDASVDIYRHLDYKILNRQYKVNHYFALEWIKHVCIVKSYIIDSIFNINEDKYIRNIDYNDLKDSLLSNHIAACGFTFQVCIFDSDPLNTRIKRLKSHPSQILSVTWNKKYRHLLASSCKVVVKIWDVMKRVHLHDIPLNTYGTPKELTINYCTWSNDPKIILILHKNFGIKSFNIDYFKLIDKPKVYMINKDDPTVPSKSFFKNKIKYFQNFDELISNFDKDEEESKTQIHNIEFSQKLYMSKIDEEILTHLFDKNNRLEELYILLDASINCHYAKPLYIPLLQYFDYNVRFNWIQDYLDNEPHDLLEVIMQLACLGELEMIVEVLISKHYFKLATYFARIYSPQHLIKVRNEYAKYSISIGDYDQTIIENLLIGKNASAKRTFNKSYKYD